VYPEKAISKSWIIPAPFRAKPDIQPSFIKSMRTGFSPTFMGCAPRAQRMAFFLFFAFLRSEIRFLRSLAAKISGRPDKNVSKDPGDKNGFAKCEIVTFPFMDL